MKLLLNTLQVMLCFSACGLPLCVYSQNVGIGTNTPTQKLDVAGNVKISGALMPGGTAGTAGQVLVSAGANTAPVWESSTSLSPIGGKVFTRIITNTAISSTRGIFSNSSTAQSQSDSVDFVAPDYNIGTDITVISTSGVGNKVLINTTGLYQINGRLTLLLQNVNNSLNPLGRVELRIAGASTSLILSMTTDQPLTKTTSGTNTTYVKTFDIDQLFYFSAGDSFTLIGAISNLSGTAPHVNIGIVSPANLNVMKISD